MPTVLDATVVASAYDTSGNGGRKLVKLSNGWLVAVVKTATYAYFYVDKYDDNGFTQLCYCNMTITINDISIASKGNVIYVIVSYTNGSASSVMFFTFNALTQSNVDLYNSRIAVDSAQTALGNVSLAINGNYLEATWVSKNSTYPNSFNTRYARGTINGDGSVSWGSVVQVSKQSDSYIQNTEPSICVNADGIPLIFVKYQSYNGSTANTIYYIRSYKIVNGIPSANSDVYYSNGNYAQSSPSAIFIPQEIAIKNPLFASATQGVIVVAWHGKDATDTVKDNIRWSYSLDGGITWSAMQKLTSGNSYSMYFPSITTNKNCDIFILYCGFDSNDNWNDVLQIKNINGVWQSSQKKAEGTTGQKYYPSSLYDLTFSLSFSEPLFIYKDEQNSKVGFYGTWTVTEISIQQGHLGEKTDRANLLTYSITTDGEMSTITEKVNGVVVGTKTAVSGGSLIAGLTQEQWDAVRFGKYDDANVITSDIIPVIVPTDWQTQATWSSVSGVGSAIQANGSGTYIAYARLLNYISNFNSLEYTVSIASGYWLNVLEADSNDILLKATYNLANGSKFKALNATKRLYIAILRTDGVAITSADITAASPKLTNSYKEYPSNTLTIEMGTETWTYTFDKRLAADADILSAVKAVADAQSTVLAAIKQQLVDKVGGDVADSFENLINGVIVKHEASGTLTSSASTRAFTNYTGGTINQYYIALDTTILGFIPKEITVYRADKTGVWITKWRNENYFYINEAQYSNANVDAQYYRVPYINGLLYLPVLTNNISCTWEATE